ncbi:hypothetical protein BDN72DRAFT_857916 [Pluteus cervinus]|uniref:Uncharacterized protein n=1 Tax=Pluteus cervinus TaxID=181527 RepID=A0ACD3AUX3_9AGAR|nr:hypothetical protein BDN72DRAFT_857916 [Pluteus cervinus]
MCRFRIAYKSITTSYIEPTSPVQHRRATVQWNKTLLVGLPGRHRVATYEALKGMRGGPWLILGQEVSSIPHCKVHIGLYVGTISIVWPFFNESSARRRLCRMPGILLDLQAFGSTATWPDKEEKFSMPEILILTDSTDSRSTRYWRILVACVKAIRGMWLKNKGETIKTLHKANRPLMSSGSEQDVSAKLEANLQPKILTGSKKNCPMAKFWWWQFCPVANFGQILVMAIFPDGQILVMAIFPDGQILVVAIFPDGQIQVVAIFPDDQIQPHSREGDLVLARELPLHEKRILTISWFAQGYKLGPDPALFLHIDDIRRMASNTNPQYSVTRQVLSDSKAQWQYFESLVPYALRADRWHQREVFLRLAFAVYRDRFPSILANDKEKLIFRWRIFLSRWIHWKIPEEVNWVTWRDFFSVAQDRHRRRVYWLEVLGHSHIALVHPQYEMAFMGHSVQSAYDECAQRDNLPGLGFWVPKPVGHLCSSNQAIVPTVVAGKYHAKTSNTKSYAKFRVGVLVATLLGVSTSKTSDQQTEAVEVFVAMLSTIDLSQEILDEIVGHLHDDEEALQTLSVVSSNFLPICRALLFYSLRLDFDNCALWNGRLRDCPTLGLAIKDVELRVAGFQDEEERRLLDVLDKVTGPIKITLCNPPQYSATLWSDIPLSLQQTIARIVSRPIVQNITAIKFMNIPISLFSGMRYCQRLELVYCSFAALELPTSEPEQALSGRGPKSSVKALVVSESHSLYAKNQHPLYEFVGHSEFPLDVSNLSRLYVELFPENVEKVRHLLFMCAQSLHYLSFFIRGATTSIRHLSALQVLEIKLDITHYSLHPQLMHSVLSAFLRTLESLRDDPDEDFRYQHLPEEIYIPTTIVPSYLQQVPQKFWADLDSLLIKLSPVHVRIVAMSLNERREQMPDLRAFLPTLERTGRRTRRSQVVSGKAFPRPVVVDEMPKPEQRLSSREFHDPFCGED